MRRRPKACCCTKASKQPSAFSRQRKLAAFVFARVGTDAFVRPSRAKLGRLPARQRRVKGFLGRKHRISKSGKLAEYSHTARRRLALLLRLSLLRLDHRNTAHTCQPLSKVIPITTLSSENFSDIEPVVCSWRLGLELQEFEVLF